MIWIITDKKVNLQSFKPIFQITLRILDLECHTSLKIAFAIFGLIFMGNVPTEKKNTSISVKLELLNRFFILWDKKYFQNLILTF